MTIGQKLHLACALFGALTAACASSDEAPPAGAGPKAQVRIAHLATDAARVDVCLLRSDRSVGPIVSSLVGESAGIDYGKVTRYVEVPAGTYTVRLVQPGSVVCEMSIPGIPDVRGVTLDGAGHYTVATLGQVSADPLAAFDIKAFPDDVTAVGTAAKLRFIHAVPAFKSVDVGLGAAAEYQPLFTGVVFGEAATVDDKAYKEVPPISDQTLTLRKTGSTEELASLRGLSLRAGQVATIFAIGDPGAATRPVGALVCNDADETRSRVTIARCAQLSP